jgi:hypothetical protein
VQQCQLPLPSHKRTCRSGRALRHPGAALPQSLDGVDRLRRRPLQPQAAAGRPRHLLLHQVIGCRTHQERPGRSLLLEPQGALGRGAHGRHLPVGGGPELAHDHETRVHPHPDREPGAEGGETRRRGLAQALLQVERSEHGAPGMVLLGPRCPKEGDDLVPHHRLEGPPVPLHRLLRQGSEGVQRAVVRLARERSPIGGPATAQHSTVTSFHSPTAAAVWRWNDASSSLASVSGHPAALPTIP